MGIPFGGGLGGGQTPAFYRDDDESEFVLDPLTITDAGGGTYGFLDGKFCLQRIVSSGAPWEVWSTIEPGHYAITYGEILLGYDDPENFPSNSRVQILHDDGTGIQVVFDDTPFVVGSDPGWYSGFSGVVDFTVSEAPPDYQKFWTSFAKTRENAPP